MAGTLELFSGIECCKYVCNFNQGNDPFHLVACQWHLSPLPNSIRTQNDNHPVCIVGVVVVCCNGVYQQDKDNTLALVVRQKLSLTFIQF